MRENIATPALRVLLVDDWPDTTEAMAALMRLWGHDARIARDGAEALDMAALYRPHVIFLDIGLPGMDGYQVARLLRGDPRFSEVFIVSLTGRAEEEARQHSRESGCDDHLVKPVDPASIERLLAAQRQVQQDREDKAETPAPPRAPSPLLSSPSASDKEMTEAAETCLRRHSHLALKNVSCEYHEGKLTLRGCVPSYYLKQIAQSAVAEIDDIVSIANEIEVVGSSRAP